METSLKTGFAQIFSCCPKKSELPKIWVSDPILSISWEIRTDEKFLGDKNITISTV